MATKLDFFLSFAYRESMIVELNPHQEQIIRNQLASGHFHSVEEILTSALSMLRNESVTGSSPENDPVRRMTEFAETKAVKLPPGEKVSDLVHEGHTV